VLALEDVHWADAATLDVLRALVRRLDRDQLS
jgi:predicted ATPase